MTLRFTPASDRSLLISLGTDISPSVNARVHRLARHLEQLPGVTSLSPAYASLLVRFDPLRLTGPQIEERAHSLEHGLEEEEPEPAPLIEIPVSYNGPDLEEVAARHRLAPFEVVAIHSATIYHAYFAGFVPGFVYLGEVDARIATPRRDSPRKHVPPGSVAIAGTQTGVYPRATPGGWNLIGHTDEVLFDSDKGKALIEPGHRVRFVPK